MSVVSDGIEHKVGDLWIGDREDGGRVYVTLSAAECQRHAHNWQPFHWHRIDGSERWSSGTSIFKGRLVVLDPENVVEMKRLHDLWSWEGEPSPETLRLALREYLKPVPVKPPEPTGLGAVVLDTANVTWVRFEAHTGFWWRDKAGRNMRWQDFGDVTVLHEGIAVHE